MKYYTPTIEEFHVGFEYEFENRGSLYDEKNWIKQECGMIGHSKERHISEGKIRVKCLDKEDAESLGWMETKGAITRYVKCIEGAVSESRFVLEKYPHADNAYTIFYLENEGGERVIFFNGIIKNKSELVKLMKQLNLK